MDVPESSHTQANPQGGADVGSQEPPKGGMEGTDGREETVHEPPLDNMGGGDDLPPHLRDIYNKHKELHATELNAALSSFGRALQVMYCKRMGLMLSEAVEAGSRRDEAKDEVADVTFSVSGAPTAGMCDATELFPQQPKKPDATRSTKSGDPAVEVDHTNAIPGKKRDHINGSVHGNVNVHRNAKGEDSCSKDPPQVSNSPARSSGLFDVDSFLEIRARSPLFDSSPGSSTGPVYDVTPLATYPPLSTGPAEAGVDETREEEEVVEVNSGQSHDGKKPTLKRAAPAAPSARKLQKMKKIKVDATEDAIYQRYCCTNYRIKDPPEGEPLPAFIRIGGFDISFKHFSNGLKKRAHLNNEVMSLYIESFNIEQTYNSTKPRKFAFSPHVATKLCVDPSSFKTSSCIRDLTRVCEKNDIVKFDQLFFTIVQRDHWAVVVVNFMKKQFNVSDSRSLDPDYVSILEKPCCNLITNFKALVTEFNPWKQDFGTFQMSSPPSYPQQSTSFDCGIFAILYLENLTARGMKPFNTIQTHCSMSGSTLRRSFSSTLKTPSTQRTSFKLC
nr:uncharacterized protein LOC109763335 [Aegilops tauschii subsp. strangulata]